jgi:tetratricopeptide (TPR) repeat protein
MKPLCFWLTVAVAFVVFDSHTAFAAFNLEVPVEPWDEYRLQFKNYSKHLLASYDRAFIDDYEGAIREVNKAIELLPEEGIGFSERGKYYRILNNMALADNDYKAAINLFDKAIERYRPGGDKKSRKTGGVRVNPADAGHLVATLKYQRGEANYYFEQYKQANDDFAAACQDGQSAACSRIWDIKAIGKRGLQWVYLSARQYYDRKRVERPSPATVRVWIRREDPQPVQVESGPENYIQQHLELNCTTREFRLIEALVISNGSQSMSEKVAGSAFTKASAGTAPNKLMISLCPHNPPK